MFGLIAFVAFEAMAVTTVMPSVARDLDGFALYALSFAAPLASGVVGMVGAGMWSDRTGPVGPLLSSMALFSLGLVVCGTAPTHGGAHSGPCPPGTRRRRAHRRAVRRGRTRLSEPPAAGDLRVLRGRVGAAGALRTRTGRAGGRRNRLALGLHGRPSSWWSALLLIAPALRRMERHPEGTTTSYLAGWASVGAVAVLALELLGSARGLAVAGAWSPCCWSSSPFARLLPEGTLTGRRGLAAVVATRGLLSAAFFFAEAYIVYVLQDRWDLSVGQAGIALTLVGVVWALASQVQSRLGTRITHERAMQVGTTVVLAGIAGLVLTVALRVAGGDLPALLPVAAYVLAGAGMGSPIPAPASRCWRSRPTATAASTPRPFPSRTRWGPRLRCRSPASPSPRPSAAAPTRSSSCTPWLSPWACSVAARTTPREAVRAESESPALPS